MLLTRDIAYPRADGYNLTQIRRIVLTHAGLPVSVTQLLRRRQRRSRPEPSRRLSLYGRRDLDWSDIIKTQVLDMNYLQPGTFLCLTY